MEHSCLNSRRIGCGVRLNERKKMVPTAWRNSQSHRVNKHGDWYHHSNCDKTLFSPDFKMRPIQWRRCSISPDSNWLHTNSERKHIVNTSWKRMRHCICVHLLVAKRNLTVHTNILSSHWIIYLSPWNARTQNYCIRIRKGFGAIFRNYHNPFWVVTHVAFVPQRDTQSYLAVVWFQMCSSTLSFFQQKLKSVRQSQFRIATVILHLTVKILSVAREHLILSLLTQFLPQWAMFTLSSSSSLSS